MNKQTVAVLDFGSQCTQLIARRIREQNVFSEIIPHTISADDIRKFTYFSELKPQGMPI